MNRSQIAKTLFILSLGLRADFRAGKFACSAKMHLLVHKELYFEPLIMSQCQKSEVHFFALKRKYLPTCCFGLSVSLFRDFNCTPCHKPDRGPRPKNISHTPTLLSHTSKKGARPQGAVKQFHDPGNHRTCSNFKDFSFLLSKYDYFFCSNLIAWPNFVRYLGNLDPGRQKKCPFQKFAATGCNYAWASQLSPRVPAIGISASLQHRGFPGNLQRKKYRFEKIKANLLGSRT